MHIANEKLNPEYFGIFKYSWENGYLNVQGSVDLKNFKLKTLPFNFGKVEGNFDCSHNELETLENSPLIIAGDFNCSHNKLTSLKECRLGEISEFNCSNNKLSDLNIEHKRINTLKCLNNPNLKEYVKFNNVSVDWLHLNNLVVFSKKTDVRKISWVKENGIFENFRNTRLFNSFSKKLLIEKKIKIKKLNILNQIKEFLQISEGIVK